MVDLLKTTEELRKELEKLRREEFDACLDFSNKIKPLEAQLQAAEKGDLLFEDVQLQSKLAYVNDLLNNRGIPIVVARKSELVDFIPGEKIPNYKQLALFYLRSYDNGLQLIYTFEVAESVGELLTQLNLVEKQLDFLSFLCSLNPNREFPPYFTGTLGGKILLFSYDLDGFSVMDTSLTVFYDKVTERYTIKFTNSVDGFGKENDEVSLGKLNEVKTAVSFKNVKSLTLNVSKEGVRSSDLFVALEELRVCLLELKNKDKVTVELRLVTE